jgi:hypothetical protein
MQNKYIQKKNVYVYVSDGNVIAIGEVGIIWVHGLAPSK